MHRVVRLKPPPEAVKVSALAAAGGVAPATVTFTALPPRAWLTNEFCILHIAPKARAKAGLALFASPLPISSCATCIGTA